MGRQFSDPPISMKIYPIQHWDGQDTCDGTCGTCCAAGGCAAAEERLMVKGSLAGTASEPLGAERGRKKNGKGHPKMLSLKLLNKKH